MLRGTAAGRRSDETPVSSLKSFVRLLRGISRVHIALLLVLMVLSGLTQGIGILLLVPLLEILQGSSASGNPLAGKVVNGLYLLGIPPTAGGLLAVFVALVLITNAIQHGRIVMSASLQYRLVDRLRYRCYSALLGAQWRWLADSRNADHASLLLTDVNRIGNGFNFGLGLLASSATMLAYLFSALALSWVITLLALASGGLVLVLLSGQRRDALSLGRSLGASNRRLQGNVQETLAGIKLAKILGNEARHLDEFQRITHGLRRQQSKFQINTSRVRAIYQVIGAGFLAAYLYLGLEVLHTATAELLTLVLVFGRLIPMFSSAQQQYHQWLYTVPALGETERLLAECRSAAEPAAPAEPMPWPVRREIRLDAVSVRYSGRSRPALDAVSLRLSARTTTAIMGASGAGKSTLADVLMGLLNPDSGALSIDGVAVSNENRLQWRHSVAYVPQGVFLFNDTIRNNLLWGKPGASDANLDLVLHLAAADFVTRLPEGLDTAVGDGGVRLSGGERQRLALARALLKRPSLLILDEATSALDLANEARVRAAVERLHGDLTVVVIGHRLPTLEHADQVVVLEAGTIARQGAWTEVMNTRERA